MSINVAIIPARGGSKRIPRKNIREFCGRPMISWSIEAAKNAGCFDRIVVSTDDHEIAEISKQWGAEVPFMRPDTLSDDHAGTTEVIQHATESLQSQGENPDFVCCLYATASFVRAENILAGLDLLKETNADYVFPVTSYPYPIQRALKMTNSNRVDMFYPEYINSRSQDLEEAFHDAGQFYWGNAESWLQGLPVFSRNSAVLPLPRHQVQDIDTFEDWRSAEILFKLNQVTS